MPLATILGVCALLVSPSAGEVRIAISAFAEVTQSQQDSPAAKPTQQPDTPEPGSKPTPASEAPPAASPEPAQQNPPHSGAPGTTETTEPVPPAEAQPSQTPAPAETETKPAAKPPATAKPASTHRRKTTTKPHVAAKPGTKSASTKHPPTHKAHAKTSAKPVSPSTQSPKKVVVRNGSTADPAVQLSPSLSQQQVSSQRQKIDQLLSDTDANLDKLSSQQITSTQSDTVNQVQQYVKQAKTAADAGDMERAGNLAVKAHLLSEELVKH